MGEIYVLIQRICQIIFKNWLYHVHYLVLGRLNNWCIICLFLDEFGVLVYLFERQKDRGRRCSHLLVYFLSSHNDWVLPRDPVSWAVTTTFHGVALSGSWRQEPATETIPSYSDWNVGISATRFNICSVEMVSVFELLFSNLLKGTLSNLIYVLRQALGHFIMFFMS